MSCREMAAKLWLRLKAVFRILFVVINHLYCLPAYFVWMLVIFLPVRAIKSRLYWRIEGVLIHWLTSLVSLWIWSGSYDVEEIGDDILGCMYARTLVVSNHRSTADVLMMMTSFDRRPRIVEDIVWIMSRQFKYTSFGLLSMVHGDFFVNRGSANTIESLAKHLEDVYVARDRKFIVLFPEGGFLKNHRESSVRFTDRLGLPPFDQVSVPRTGAFKAVLDGVELDYVLDLTILYPEAEPLDGLDLLKGSTKPCKVIFYYRLYPASDCLESPEDWLLYRWLEKEKVLQGYYKDGCIDGKPISSFRPRLVAHSPLRFFLVNLFFISSLYFQYLFFKAVFVYASSALS